MATANLARETGQIFEDKERTKDVITGETVEFKDLHLSHNILSGLTKSNFIRPSPIQLKAIPYGRCGLDLIVQAKSGTGKTCVFTVVALESIVHDKNTLQAIVLAPTREIALQISDVVKAIGQDIKLLNVGIFIGGLPVSNDCKNSENCQIAVGSPGRIKQLIELGALSCKNVRLFVIDEADKLLSESFQEQINWIYSNLPTNKQMIAASATYPEELALFLQNYMRNPTFIRLNPKDMALVGLKQYYVKVQKENAAYKNFEKKITTVTDLLTSMQFKQVLVFSNYHSHAKSLCEACISAGFPSTFISGGMEQEKRINAINMLKKFQCRVLISTDLTSRGIDSHNVDVVINMDIPTDWETYMHRIGRAGRFGARGVAITIACEGEECERIKEIEHMCNMEIFPYPGTVHLSKTKIAATSNVKSVNVHQNSNGFNSSDTKLDCEDFKISKPVHKPAPEEQIYLPSLHDVMQTVGLPPKLPISCYLSYDQMKEDLEYYVENKEFKEWKLEEVKIHSRNIEIKQEINKSKPKQNVQETIKQETNSDNTLPHDLNTNGKYIQSNKNREINTNGKYIQSNKNRENLKQSTSDKDNLQTRLKEHKKKLEEMKLRSDNTETEIKDTKQIKKRKTKQKRQKDNNTNFSSNFLLPRFTSLEEEHKFYNFTKNYHKNFIKQQAEYYKMCHKYWKDMANYYSS